MLTPDESWTNTLAPRWMLLQKRRCYPINLPDVWLCPEPVMAKVIGFHSTWYYENGGKEGVFRTSRHRLGPRIARGRSHGSL